MALADGSPLPPLNHPGDDPYTFPPPPDYSPTESFKEIFHILRGNMQLISVQIIHLMIIVFQLRDVSLYPPDGFQLGVLQGSISEKYFRNHVNYDYRQIYKSSLRLNLMDNFREGTLRLQNR